MHFECATRPSTLRNRERQQSQHSFTPGMNHGKRSIGHTARRICTLVVSAPHTLAFRSRSLFLGQLNVIGVNENETYRTQRRLVGHSQISGIPRRIRRISSQGGSHGPGAIRPRRFQGTTISARRSRSLDVEQRQRRHCRKVARQLITKRCSVPCCGIRQAWFSDRVDNNLPVG